MFLLKTCRIFLRHFIKPETKNLFRVLLYKVLETHEHKKTHFSRRLPCRSSHAFKILLPFDIVVVTLNILL